MLDRGMESWFYMVTGQQNFAARKALHGVKEDCLVFSISCNDHFEWKDICRENLELLDHLVGRVLNAKSPNTSELFSRRERQISWCKNWKIRKFFFLRFFCLFHIIFSKVRFSPCIIRISQISSKLKEILTNCM